MLLGSSLLPSMVWIANDRPKVQLGDVVRRAQLNSKLTPQEWNDLNPILREVTLAKTVHAMRTEAKKDQK